MAIVADYVLSVGELAGGWQAEFLEAAADAEFLQPQTRSRGAERSVRGVGPSVLAVARGLDQSAASRGRPGSKSVVAMLRRTWPTGLARKRLAGGGARGSPRSTSR